MQKALFALIVSITLGLSTPMNAGPWEWLVNKWVTLKTMVQGFFYKTPTYTPRYTQHMTESERAQEEQEVKKFTAWLIQIVEKSVDIPKSESQILTNKNSFIDSLEILKKNIEADSSLSDRRKNELFDDLYKKASFGLLQYVQRLQIFFDKERISCQIQEINYDILVCEYEKEKLKRESCEANKK